jgi:hypothetical protein
MEMRPAKMVGGILLLLVAGSLLVSCRNEGPTKEHFMKQCALLTDWQWYDQNVFPFNWKCKKVGGTEEMVGIDLDRNGRYKVNGDPNDPVPGRRPEVWCRELDGERWIPIPCPFATLDAAREECESNDGTWTSQTESRAFCAFPADDLAVVVHDDDGDGLIYNTEFHCEGLNEEGLPDGQEVTCPGEE